MEEILYDRKTVEVDDERYCKMVLSYYLIEEEIAVEYCELKSYGVEVRKTAHFADEHTEKECKRISNLFFNRSEAEQFLEKIARNKVTPIGLKDVVEDYAGKQVQIRKPVQV